MPLQPEVPLVPMPAPGPEDALPPRGVDHGSPTGSFVVRGKTKTAGNSATIATAVADARTTVRVRTMVSAVGRHGAACDDNVTARAFVTAADTCTASGTFCFHSTSGNLDGTAASTTSLAIAAADASATAAADGRYSVSADGNGAAVAAVAAADARTTSAASGRYRASPDGNGDAVAVGAAADASAIGAASSFYLAAVDGDGAAVAFVAAADACA